MSAIRCAPFHFDRAQRFLFWYIYLEKYLKLETKTTMYIIRYGSSFLKYTFLSRDLAIFWECTPKRISSALELTEMLLGESSRATNVRFGVPKEKIARPLEKMSILKFNIRLLASLCSLSEPHCDQISNISQIIYIYFIVLFYNKTKMKQFTSHCQCFGWDCGWHCGCGYGYGCDYGCCCHYGCICRWPDLAFAFYHYNVGCFRRYLRWNAFSLNFFLLHTWRNFFNISQAMRE